MGWLVSTYTYIEDQYLKPYIYKPYIYILFEHPVWLDKSDMIHDYSYYQPKRLFHASADMIHNLCEYTG